ncbi:serine protease [Croceibacterium mercuriale]|uniref:Serine protease n=1 Tax=Croceibacterium mercuriale TaxID=1572751 RepID=A0A0B2BXQ4_9SPHN|nr:signal peptide peptidase SppA [Croceibacterium mercuriale]KHL24466.1 serine protease [Croceibacterium mercuriale]
MSFARKVWHLLVGIKDALVLVFMLLFFTVLFAALSARPSADAVRDGALLLQLDGTVVEEVAPADPFNLLLPSAAPTREYAARDLVRAIDAAAGDTRIKLLALDLSTFLGGGQVHMLELAEAIDRFRKTGKPVTTYALAYTDDTLLLAAHSSEVWVDPMGGAVVRGPGGQNLYYGPALDRLGINARVYRVGTYKSAVEPWELGAMSEPARRNATELYSTIFARWQENVSAARPRAQLTRASHDVVALIQANNGDTARAAIAAGLADKAGTLDDWGKHVAARAGTDPLDKAPGAFAHTTLDAWLAELGPETPTASFMGSGPSRIGVITIAGEITDGTAGPGSAGAERIVAALDDALDDNLAGLVVRVDSPGGSVSGSEAIRRAVLRHKARGIPVAISMANIAASGGYWVATTGDRIFATPSTVTGSIGVFGVIPTFEDALARFGVTSDGVRTTPLSGQPDPISGFTPAADALLQATVSSTYDRFLGLVAEARGIDRARADELGQGRVWDGGTARQLGLVDQFGNLDDALGWVAGRAKLADGTWAPAFLEQEQTGYGPLVAGMMQPSGRTRAIAPDLFAAIASSESDQLGRALADLTRLFGAQGVQARCLECPALAAPTRPARADEAGLLAMMRAFLAR